MTKDIESDQAGRQPYSPIVNDFCMTVCTVNGSGSATANTTLLRAMFHMGIPVSGKNIFPSNIKGLPTWFSIRVSKDGYLGRVAHDDIIVQMNPVTWEEDLNYDVPGGVIFYADHIDLPIHRDDVIAYAMPVKALIKEADIPHNLQDYMENMVYVGVVAQMLGIDLDVVQQVLLDQFKKRPSVAESNFAIVKLAADWARDNLEKRDRYSVEAMPPLKDYIMTDGNTAGALGAIYGGFQFCGWYPITPATSLAESLNTFAPRLRKDPDTGKHTFAIVQAEDELASIGMAVGAGWAGLRAMSSTSGPGISLMTEYMSMAYYAEVPLVLWDVQRVGPSTGLPTRTAQCDLNLTYFLGHGDTQQLILIPSSVTECFEFGWKAFDYAEEFQTPVIILSDLDLGMNLWMTKKFEYPDQPINRGKILWEEDLEHFGKDWGRYLDVDGDGIPYRTVMGNQNEKAPYFTRGTGHDEYGNYSEDPVVWQRMMDRIKMKFENARERLPKPVLRTLDGAEIGLVVMGSTEPAAMEAQDKLATQGLPVDLMRIRALPFSKDVRSFIEAHKRNYIVELNRDGQLHQLLQIDHCDMTDRLVSLAYLDGLPITAEYIIKSVIEKEQNNG
ncbi:MAG: 2-oxoacid:acceptor oxidoreductase subunit alpha [Anaerolineaceae bacterium]|nr:2-oxoacid:acceptor oxidoreductase subunit alpha [Anaerolineaceae bacterium]